MEIEEDTPSGLTEQRHEFTGDNPLTTDQPVKGGASFDEYAYTERNNFTSEIFKIEVANIPYHMSPKDFKKLLTVRLRLQPHKIKMFNIRRSRFAFVTFKNEKLREESIKLLDGYKYKQVTFRAELAKPRADPVQKARKQERLSEEGLAEEGQSVLDVVIPWHSVPYEDQLVKKQNSMIELLTKLGTDLSRQQTRDFNETIRTLKRRFNRKTICEVIDICRSPREECYRNKNEFTPGKDENGKIVIGFRKASYKKGSTEVGGVSDEMKHLPKLAIKVAKMFEEYFQQCADCKPPYNAEGEDGFWRQLTVRTSEIGQCMVIVLMHPQNLSTEEIQKEIQKLSDYYDSTLKDVITSMYFQLFDKKGNVHPLQHVGGNRMIQERLLGLTFEISPPSFFQINTAAAEILYQRIFDLAQLTTDSTVLDLFCGTGSIGLTMASKIKKMIGAEIIPEAIENARKVASNHGIHNCEFIAGKAEDMLSLALQKISEDKNVVAILDPPRQGVHKRIIKLLRSCNNISSIVYVACNPSAVMPNVIDFCKQPSNNYRGEPFFPVLAQPVDMFPHTPHTELILVLKRYEEVVSCVENQTTALNEHEIVETTLK